MLRSHWSVVRTSLGTAAELKADEGLRQGDAMLRLRQKPQNIMILVLDGLRQDCVSFCPEQRLHDRYKLEPRPHTPTLDQLAERGTLFSQALTPATATGPAHAALLTSRYPAEHGIETPIPTPLSVGIPTLTSLLGHAGYHTVHALDFEECFARTGLNRGAKKIFHHDDARVIEHVISHRATSRSGLFLYAHFGDLHHPYLRTFDPNATPESHREAYRAHYSRLRRQFQVPDVDEGLRQAVAISRGQPFPAPRGPVRQVMDDFYTLRTAIQQEGNYFPTIFPLYQEAINRFDQGRLANFIQALNDAELLDDTLLIVTSGHGESNLGMNQFDHGLDLTDGAIRVPLLFSFPGVIHERYQLDAPVSLLDIMPTVLEMAGVNIDRMLLRGNSLTGSLVGRVELPSDRALYAEQWRAKMPEVDLGARDEPSRTLLVQRAMRTDRYKLVLQGPDLTGDEQVLHFVDQELDLRRFVDAVNHRYMGLGNPNPLEAWIRARQLSLDPEKTDILTELLLLTRSTLGKDRYPNLHARRLRSLLAERIQAHYREGTLNVAAMVQDFYEAWFLEFPSEATLQRLTVLVRHHCKDIEDVMEMFLQISTYQQRYHFFDLEMDPFEETNLFSEGLSVAQERDALAIEIMLMEVFLEGRGLMELREAARTPHATATTEISPGGSPIPPLTGAEEAVASPLPTGLAAEPLASDALPRPAGLPTTPSPTDQAPLAPTGGVTQPFPPSQGR